MLTPWGYEVDELPDLITVSDFNAATNDRYAGDARIEPAISAASAAIRAYCGWHVAPVLDCTITLDGEVGDIWLPTNALASVACSGGRGFAAPTNAWIAAGERVSWTGTANGRAVLFLEK